MLFIKIMSVIDKKGNNLCYNYTVLLKRNKMNFLCLMDQQEMRLLFMR